MQKIGQELVDNLNSWAADFVVADRTGAWVRSAYRFFCAADAEAFARHQAQHQWVSVKRWQIVPTEDLPTNEWNADTCEAVKLVPAEICWPGPNMGARGSQHLCRTATWRDLPIFGS